MSNASVQRGRQACCEEADEPANAAVRRQDFIGAGHPCRHPLQLEEGLAVAGKGGADIRERS